MRLFPVLAELAMGGGGRAGGGGDVAFAQSLDAELAREAAGVSPGDEGWARRGGRKRKAPESSSRKRLAARLLNPGANARANGNLSAPKAIVLVIATLILGPESVS